jgi:hypothetical protein
MMSMFWSTAMTIRPAIGAQALVTCDHMLGVACWGACNAASVPLTLSMWRRRRITQ